ncbi:MAG: cellulase family glycosylhydrolase [Deltaproteobacteria bacterium]|nr:cellulase family glycosylhydrolase [Deltaproteobacteria bacterium]
MIQSLPFVERSGCHLEAAGVPLRLLGTNCYFLQEEGARQALQWEGYEGRVDEAMNKLSHLGMGVIRAWAFNDDPENPAAIQNKPGQLSEAGCAGIDRAIELASKLGVRLILSLVNYWPDYGGVAQYLRWHGIAGDNPADFFTNKSIRSHFGEHIEALLGRVNPRTGRAWGQDPAVMAWELMNEPRGKGLDPEGHELADWVAEMAGRIKKAAPKQLVATGEEGLAQGCNFELNSRHVDLASIHLYPEEWAWPEGDWAAAGTDWIHRHAVIAERIKRPLILGEFGLRKQVRRMDERGP